MNRIKQLPSFYLKLVTHPVPLFFAAAFVSAKIWSNVSATGGNLFFGVRSGVMGLVVYALAAGVIYLLSEKPLGHRFHASSLDSVRARRLGLPLMLLVYLFIMASIVDKLQRVGYIGGNPVYSYLPGYTFFYNLLENISMWQAPIGIPGFRDYMLVNTLRGQIMFVLIPLVILLALGLRRGGFALTGGDLKPAYPFLAIYILAFLFSEITTASLVFLLYALLYPAVCEEFFFRGVLQPMFTGVLKSAAWGIGLSAILFALLHFPDYAFRVYAMSLPLAISNVASVALFGLLMSYGAYRTGMLWPWMLIHAISNVVGW